MQTQEQYPEVKLHSIEYPDFEPFQLEHLDRALEKGQYDADFLLDVPYTHQLWNTPYDFHGGWACGPTSAFMLLNFLGCFPVSPANKEPSAFISEPFRVNGYDYERTVRTKVGVGSGLYGAICGAIGRGVGGHVFAQSDGTLGMLETIKAISGKKTRFENGQNRYMSRAEFTSIASSSLTRGMPAIFSTHILTPSGKRYHHLMLLVGLTKDGDGIFHDPYGFRAGKGNDGALVSYTHKELEPKYAVTVS